MRGFAESSFQVLPTTRSLWTPLAASRTAW